MKRGVFNGPHTYGDMGDASKAICWFQPRDLRKLEAMLVKDAFLRYWKAKFAHNSKAFKDYINCLRSMGFFTYNRLRLKDLKACEKIFQRKLEKVKKSLRAKEREKLKREFYEEIKKDVKLINKTPHSKPKEVSQSFGNARHNGAKHAPPEDTSESTSGKSNNHIKRNLKRSKIIIPINSTIKTPIFTGNFKESKPLEIKKCKINNNIEKTQVEKEKNKNGNMESDESTDYSGIKIVKYKNKNDDTESDESTSYSEIEIEKKKKKNKNKNVNMESEEISNHSEIKIVKEVESNKNNNFISIKNVGRFSTKNIATEPRFIKDVSKAPGLIAIEPNGPLDPDGRLFLRYMLKTDKRSPPSLSKFRNTSKDGDMVRLDQNDFKKPLSYGRGFGRWLCWFQPWGNRVRESLMVQVSLQAALEKAKRTLTRRQKRGCFNETKDLSQYKKALVAVDKAIQCLESHLTRERFRITPEMKGWIEIIRTELKKPPKDLPDETPNKSEKNLNEQKNAKPERYSIPDDFQEIFNNRKEDIKNLISKIYSKNNGSYKPKELEMLKSTDIISLGYIKIEELDEFDIQLMAELARKDIEKRGVKGFIREARLLKEFCVVRLIISPFIMNEFESNWKDLYNLINETEVNDKEFENKFIQKINKLKLPDNLNKLFIKLNIKKGYNESIKTITYNIFQSTLTKSILLKYKECLILKNINEKTRNKLVSSMLKKLGTLNPWANLRSEGAVINLLARSGVLPKNEN